MSSLSTSQMKNRRNTPHLPAKPQEGGLTAQEEADLNEFVTTNTLLTVLQSKARISLKKRNPAA